MNDPPEKQERIGLSRPRFLIGKREEDSVFTICSFSHMTFGIVAKTLGISLPVFLLLHQIVEIIENSIGGPWISKGNGWIHTFFRFQLYPDGPDQPDTLFRIDCAANSAGDTLAALLGWWMLPEHLGSTLRSSFSAFSWAPFLLMLVFFLNGRSVKTDAVRAVFHVLALIGLIIGFVDVFGH